MTFKNIVEIIIIPLTLALLAYIWPAIQATSRRRAFEGLIFRELEEIEPHPPEPEFSHWWEHQQKRFIHQQIFDKPSENRDFILSLDPDLVYFVSQLWQARANHDWVQWDNFLKCLSDPRWDKNGGISKVRQQWQQLEDAYQKQSKKEP